MDAGTAERVYTRLKEAVLSGAISMYARIDFAEVAETFSVSTTPVREAAMRLFGEGLLEPHDKGGLRAMLVSESHLRGHLELNNTLLASALSSMTSDVSDADDKASLETRTRLLFRAIARQTGSSALEDQIERLSDRLAVYRVCEPIVMTDVAEELGRLRRSAADASALRKSLRHYHRRRLSHAAQLVWAASAQRSAPRSE